MNLQYDNPGTEISTLYMPLDLVLEVLKSVDADKDVAAALQVCKAWRPLAEQRPYQDLCV